jgi:hypothetical protein
MVSFAWRSVSLSTESRWSGIPETTTRSQVAQVPSRQEESATIPASSTPSRMERSGGTSRTVSPLPRGRAPPPVVLRDGVETPPPGHGSGGDLGDHAGAHQASQEVLLDGR